MADRGGLGQPGWTGSAAQPAGDPSAAARCFWTGSAASRGQHRSAVQPAYGAGQRRLTGSGDGGAADGRSQVRAGSDGGDAVAPRGRAVVPDGPRRAAQPRRRAGPGSGRADGGYQARAGRPTGGSAAPRRGQPADGARGAGRASARRAGPRHGPARAGDETGTRLDIPAEITADQLDPAAAAELRTLPADLAAAVARRLVAASLAEDPETSYQLAREARRLAARVGIVRETAGIAAYRAGHWAEALTELRAARRLTGRTSYLPMMADAERALGRLDRALAVLAEPQAGQVDRATQIELLIVESGIRRDQGLPEAAAVTLQVPELTDGRLRPWSARLFYAYADALLDAGRTEEARDWFGRAAHADQDEQTDAAERYDDLDDVVIDDLADGDDRADGDDLGDGNELADGEDARGGRCWGLTGFVLAWPMAAVPAMALSRRGPGRSAGPGPSRAEGYERRTAATGQGAAGAAGQGQMLRACTGLAALAWWSHAVTTAPPWTARPAAGAATTSSISTGSSSVPGCGPPACRSGPSGVMPSWSRPARATRRTGWPCWRSIGPRCWPSWLKRRKASSSSTTRSTSTGGGWRPAMPISCGRPAGWPAPAESAAAGHQDGSSRSSQCMMPATLPSVPLTASNRAATSGSASGASAAYRCRVRSCTMATA